MFSTETTHLDSHRRPQQPPTWTTAGGNSTHPSSSIFNCNYNPFSYFFPLSIYLIFLSPLTCWSGVVVTDDVLSEKCVAAI
uniref:Uncharacterized protein n=1 Tax=Nelumbo nucifera TaxID=4432 RepID=A0A822YLG1_NELNU|nr:TPA_asm: hypothetical protein HUJ06_012271 [Nelumbo nucifera]